MQDVTEQSAYFPRLFYVIETRRLGYRTKTESSRTRCLSNVIECHHGWHLDNKHTEPSGKVESVLWESYGRRVLKGIVHAEVKGEVDGAAWG